MEDKTQRDHVGRNPTPRTILPTSVGNFNFTVLYRERCSNTRVLPEQFWTISGVQETLLSCERDFCDRDEVQDSRQSSNYCHYSRIFTLFQGPSSAIREFNCHNCCSSLGRFHLLLLLLQLLLLILVLLLLVLRDIWL